MDPQILLDHCVAPAHEDAALRASLRALQRSRRRVVQLVRDLRRDGEITPGEAAKILEDVVAGRQTQLPARLEGVAK